MVSDGRALKYLIIYKGDFSEEVAGVAVRYLSVARELVSFGHHVTIAGRRTPVIAPKGIVFLQVVQLGALIRSFRQADHVILHGGGPIILLLAAFFASPRRRILLDGFAPHWLEIYSALDGRSLSMAAGLKYRAKIFMNYVRMVWARLFFHGISVGTPRQLDLVRGIVTQVGDLDLDKRMFLITGGCDTSTVEKAVEHAAPLQFGWIGGLWDWFDERPLVDAMIQIARAGQPVEMNFYGVRDDKVRKIIAYVKAHGGDANIFRFNPWVPFSRRFAEWSRLDVGIVWSQPSLENDYASRTRNFDCITLGMPVIQNEDSFWARIIQDNSCGIVVEASDRIADAMMCYVLDRDRLAEHSRNMRKLETQFSWKKIAGDYECAFSHKAVRINKLVSTVIAIPMLVSLMLAFALNLRLSRNRDAGA